MALAVLDYGAGNLTSVGKALSTIGAEFVITSLPRDLDDADGVIVPGVGNIAATRSIDVHLRDALQACAGVKPLLGVCLGLQFLFEGSEEAPGVAGLELLKGRCFRLPPTAKVPHVGWNTVDIIRPSTILDGIQNGTSFYFTHSYAAPVTDACVGRTEYTAPFAAVVEARNVFGVQFHPEKSGDAGLRVLRNFLQFTTAC
jgi:glutamine amidotransferase